MVVLAVIRYPWTVDRAWLTFSVRRKIAGSRELGARHMAVIPCDREP